jgi:hypothetical protein
MPLSMIESPRIARLRNHPEIQVTIKEVMQRNSDSTFLWAVLVIEELKKNVLAVDAVDIVKETPSTIVAVFHQMMEKVNQLPTRNRQRCLRFLSTAVFVYRPLHMLEIRTIAGLPVEKKLAARPQQGRGHVRFHLYRSREPCLFHTPVSQRLPRYPSSQNCPQIESRRCPLYNIPKVFVSYVGCPAKADGQSLLAFGPRIFPWTAPGLIGNQRGVSRCSWCWRGTYLHSP